MTEHDPAREGMENIVSRRAAEDDPDFILQNRIRDEALEKAAKECERAMTGFERFSYFERSALAGHLASRIRALKSSAQEG